MDKCKCVEEWEAITREIMIPIETKIVALAHRAAFEEVIKLSFKEVQEPNHFSGICEYLNADRQCS